MSSLSFFTTSTLLACALSACGGNVVVDESTGGQPTTSSGAGTGGIAPGSSTLVCNTGFGECITIIGPGAAQGACAGATAMVLPSCPPGIGTCTAFKPPGWETIVTDYAELGQSAAMLQANCVLAGGTWSE